MTKEEHSNQLFFWKERGKKLIVVCVCSTASARLRIMAVMRFSSSAASGVKVVTLPLMALYVQGSDSAHIHG